MDADQIKRDNPIAEVLARYGVELSGRGKNLKGRCPFHDDRRPSLSVSVDKGLWYCHACDLGGDAITFVQEMENVDFRGACEILSGGRLPEPDRPLPSKWRQAPKRQAPQSKLTRIQKEVLDLAIRVYHTTLVTGRKGPDTPYHYLLERGLTVETIQEFQVGYCSGDTLQDALRYVRSDPAYAEGIGLLQRDGPRVWELFSGRITFVERDRRRRVVHMAGRAFQRDAADKRRPRAKYLFLPDLPKPVYGLSRIDYSHPVFVVEGIFDYITIHQWGYQAVATLGTSIKERDAQNLAQAVEVIFVSDNDAAGVMAAARWKEAIGHGHVLQLPSDAGDTNDLAQKPDGQESFHRLVDGPPRPVYSLVDAGPLFVAHDLHDCGLLWQWGYRAAAVEGVPVGSGIEDLAEEEEIVFVLGRGEGAATTREWRRAVGRGRILHLPDDAGCIGDLGRREGEERFRRLLVDRDLC